MKIQIDFCLLVVNIAREKQNKIVEFHFSLLGTFPENFRRIGGKNKNVTDRFWEKNILVLVSERLYFILMAYHLREYDKVLWRIIPFRFIIFLYSPIALVRYIPGISKDNPCIAPMVWAFLSTTVQLPTTHRKVEGGERDIQLVLYMWMRLTAV